MTLKFFRSPTLSPVLAILLAVCSFPAALAKDYPTIQELRDELINKSGLTEAEIAQSLTDQQSGTELRPQLVRWPESDLHLVVIAAAVSTEDFEEFNRSMARIASLVPRKIHYCIQNVGVFPDGDYRPLLSDEQFRCELERDTITIVIDQSANPPIRLFHDLRDRARADEERGNWSIREKASSDFFAQPSCKSTLEIDQTAKAIRSASGYVRLDASGNDNRTVQDCFHAVPYVIFGVLPVHRPGGRLDFIPQMLQLLYSPQLRQGMTQGEIIAALGG